MPPLDHVYTAVHKTISLLPQAAGISSGDTLSMCSHLDFVIL